MHEVWYPNYESSHDDVLQCSKQEPSNNKSFYSVKEEKNENDEEDYDSPKIKIGDDINSSTNANYIMVQVLADLQEELNQEQEDINMFFHH